MALPGAQVLVLEDVMRLVRLDVPHLVDIRGAESVRAAAEMAALLKYKLGRAEIEEEVPSSTENGREEEVTDGTGTGSDADAEEYEFGFGDSDDDDEGEAVAEDDDDDDKGCGNGWIVPKSAIFLSVLLQFRIILGMAGAA